MRARDVGAHAHTRTRVSVCVDVISVFKWTAGRISKKVRQMSGTVEQQIVHIKANMPETYKSIQAKAQAIGKVAFAYVRRGLRGEPNCFYAFERGYVVGTPFTLTEVARDIAQYMVTFGITHAVVWHCEAETQATPPIGTPPAETHPGNSTPAGAPVAGAGKSPVNSPKAGG